MSKLVIIPEDKDRINKIKAKYNNLSMSDSNASKIIRLETAGKVLSAASIATGILFVIDVFVPDPVIGLDEAALGGISALTKPFDTIVKNKIDDLANDKDGNLNSDDVSKISDGLVKMAGEIKKSRSK